MATTLGEALILLGSTGSIGCNALEIAQAFHIQVETLVAGKNLALLNQQIATFKPKIVVIADQNDAHKLQANGAKVLFGSQGILEAISLSSSSLVLNALVGFIGLEPTLHSIALGKKVALANKESLVCGGWLIDTSKLIPVDSEHFSLWHLLQNHSLEKLIITASGGAFRDTPIESISNQNAQNALKHPNWNMGKKITIDSASMVNKLLEILEAYWLFGIQEIDALIERSSIIHGIVRYKDGSMGMHLAHPDMKLAISYALNPHLASQDSLIKPLGFEDFVSLRLEQIDPRRYPLWELKGTLLANPHLGIILNASNEVAVEGFLEERYLFGKITEAIFKCMDHFSNTPKPQNLKEILELDREVRKYTREILSLTS